jgi:TnpA family transposase
LSSDRPSGLTQAIIEAGKINKTLYLLNYIDDGDYRRRILIQLNLGESRHAVARAICHGQKGEIRKRYQDGQGEQLGALGLVTNAVVLWNRKATKKENWNKHIKRTSQLHDQLNDNQESSGQRSLKRDNNEKSMKILIKMHETRG